VIIIAKNNPCKIALFLTFIPRIKLKIAMKKYEIILVVIIAALEDII
jgi:hypothetical protein